MPWRTGDMAECIRDDWLAPVTHLPKVGTVAMVVAVREGHSRWRKLGHGLQLLGFQGLWDATAFQRVPPLASEETRHAVERLDA